MRLTNLTWPKAQEYFEKNDMVLIFLSEVLNVTVVTCHLELIH